MDGDAGAGTVAAAPPHPPSLACDEKGAVDEVARGENEANAATTATATTAAAVTTTTTAHHEASAQQPVASPSGIRIPRTVDDIYDDHAKRRMAILRALTEDQDAFFAACDPARENLCLYGEPDGATWTVAPPADDVPPEIPEPTVGINFARDGMRRSDWLALVAAHSDAWLRAVAWYFGAGLDRSGRAALFARMNSKPSLYEVATGRSRGGGAGGGAAAAGAGGGGGGGVVSSKAAAKRAAVAAAKAAAGAGGGTAANGKPPPPPLKTRQPGADPDAGVVLGAGGARAAAAPLATGKILTEADVFPPSSASSAASSSATALPSLVGRRCELLWPEDGLWYLVEILEVDASKGDARVRYSSGEEERLSLREVAREGHMSLLQD